LIDASKQIAKVLKKGDIVVYESTVYPGTTEEVCLPILEEGSSLKAGKDFFLGYSPERINPSDTKHEINKVPKVIAAQNEKVLGEIDKVYSACTGSTYRVSDIKTAEAVKILENTQRDINIAIMNEFTGIMHALDIIMNEVLQAAKTKWNFVDCKPGFVGWHCISVDPLYLAFKAKKIGVNHDLLLTARKVNDNVTIFVIQELKNIILKNNLSIDGFTIGIFGVTYKENVPDVRNSLALKLIKELKAAGFHCLIHDPVANKKLLKDTYKVDLSNFEDMQRLSAGMVLVGHDYYKANGLESILGTLNSNKIIMDVPNLFVKESKDINELIYWNL